MVNAEGWKEPGVRRGRTEVKREERKGREAGWKYERGQRR